MATFRLNIAKLVVIIFTMFFIGICKLMISLNSEEFDPELSSIDGGNAYHMNQVSSLHREIAMLQDQVHELQSVYFDKLLNQTIHSKSKKFSKRCLNEIDFGIKASKTDALNGRSYVSERHVPSFTRFDMWHQYYVDSVDSETVKDKLNGLQRMLIDEVIDEAVLLLNSSQWRRDHFVEGLYQSSDTIGTHYEVYFANDKNEKRRVTLFRPQAPPVPLSHESVPYGDKLNIIVPLYGRTDAFRLFLSNFEPILVTMKYKIYLTIVYFGASAKDLMSTFQSFILKHKYRSYHIELVPNRNFSRGYALDKGIRSWKGKLDPLVFLCDVDIIFKKDFIDRCRSYPERKRRIYYPMVFSLYNPEVVEQYFDIKFTKLSDRLKISSDHGFWRAFGYGMACLYRSDYLQSGGFNLDLQEWGKEDILLFRKFAQSNLTIIRAPDPDIFHLWHHKNCNTFLSDEHYIDCIKSKTFNEGSHAQLGHMVLKDEIELHRRRRIHL